MMVKSRAITDKEEYQQRWRQSIARDSIDQADVIMWNIIEWNLTPLVVDTTGTDALARVTPAAPVIQKNLLHQTSVSSLS